MKRGRKAYLTPEGKVALMFLRMYAGLGAPKLMEELNGNIHYQLFCGIRIDPTDPLTSYKTLVSIMPDLAGRLRIQEQQTTLARAWMPYMKNLETLYTDATRCESLMRYPSDAKLLWECTGKAYKVMCGISNPLGERRMRTKYHDVERANLAYARQRKHRKSQTSHIIMRTLKLPGKILAEIRRQIRQHPDRELMGKRDASMTDVIAKAHRQQKNHFQSGDAKESIPNRIVSISKPYVRPIVRGKETRSVELGAKCNNIMTDGVSFIGKLSFNASNEGTRLKHCATLARRLLGVDIKNTGGDQGYSGNGNRTYCSDNRIQASFAPKGKKAGDETRDLAGKGLARVRATVMEGSFGTQKGHYALRKVNARLKETGILLIFFGIHTANAVQLAARIAATEKSKTEKQAAA